MTTVDKQGLKNEFAVLTGNKDFFDEIYPSIVTLSRFYFWVADDCLYFLIDLFRKGFPDPLDINRSFYYGFGKELNSELASGKNVQQAILGSIKNAAKRLQ